MLGPLDTTTFLFLLSDPFQSLPSLGSSFTPSSLLVILIAISLQETINIVIVSTNSVGTVVWPFSFRHGGDGNVSFLGGDAVEL